MTDVEVRDVLLRIGGRTLLRTNSLVAAGAGRTYVEYPYTFTRADASTCATLVDNNGILRLAEAGKPRIEWVDLDGDGIRETPGLLIEGARTNLATRSSDLGDAAWGKGATSISANAGQGADATTTADKIVEDGTTGIHGIDRTFTITAGDKVSWSGVFEAAGRTQIRLYCRSTDTDGFRGLFDISAGTYTPESAVGTGTSIAGGIIKLRSGKFRCWISGTVAAAATTTKCRVQMQNAGESYTGDGVSGVIASDMQCEVGAFVSSIIPAPVGSTVARAADSLAVPVNFGPFGLTMLGRIARPTYADATGDIGLNPRIWELGGINPMLRGMFQQAARNLEGGIITAGSNSQPTRAIPAGASLTLAVRYATITAGGVATIETSAGSTSGGTATAFSSFGNQLLNVGIRAAAPGAELGGVIVDLMCLRGLDTLAEGTAVP